MSNAYMVARHCFGGCMQIAVMNYDTYHGEPTEALNNYLLWQQLHVKQQFLSCDHSFEFRWQ